MKLKLTAFFLYLVLSGCATVIPLSQQDAMHMHTVAIDPNIDMPNGMYFQGDGSQYAAGLGLPGMCLSEQIADNDTRLIRTIANENHISLEHMIVAQISRRLNQSTPYCVNGKRPDAIMKLKVMQYGFMATNLGFSNKLAPMLYVEAQLISHHRTIWQDSISASGDTDNLPRYTMNEIAGDARLLNHMWQEVTNAVAWKLIQKLKSN